jgi:hypothetical protein
VISRAAAWRAARQSLAGQYRRLRTAHPVELLRWLRNGVLLGVAATALLYLLVAVQAGHGIDGARRTRQAITYIQSARNAVTDAGDALNNVFANEDPTLVGTGSRYLNDITQVTKDLTLAAENSAAGVAGASQIQFVSGQLETYLQLSETAVSDYGLSPSLGIATETYTNSGKDLRSALGTLNTAEKNVLKAQRGAWPLNPATFWLALIGPVIGVLLLAAATARVLARHFRRHVSRWLWGSWLTTAATAVAVGIFNSSDAQHLPADRWAGHPATMAGTLVLFLAAGVQAYLAYRPRLAEYRFRSS